jgi:hypothetical protein
MATKSMSKAPLSVNAEKALDELVEEMYDDEFAEYERFWDNVGPWRRATNWATRGNLLLFVVAFSFGSDFWTLVAVVLFSLLATGGAILFAYIQNSCAGQAVKILDRLGLLP